MNSKRENTGEENAVGKRRRAAEPGGLDDGHYWFRNFIDLPGGGHVGEWKMAEIVGGKVRQIGATAEWEQECEYLRHATWVRAEPPQVEGGDGGAVCMDTGVRRGNHIARANRDDERRLEERVRFVAEGVVDAFIETHDSTTVYYARQPEKRSELVVQIARLITKVRE